MKLISPHISYREAVYSDTAIRHGIENKPTTDQLVKMKKLATAIFEPTRKGLGDRQIRLNSFFRCQRLNKLIKGAKNSQHTLGEAMDIDNDNNPEGPTNLEIFEYIRSFCDFDQLIMENPDDKGNPAWIHVSYCEGHNRYQVMAGVKGKYYPL